MGLEVKDGPPSLEDIEGTFAELRENLEPTNPGFLTPPPDRLDVALLFQAFSKTLDCGYGYLSPEVELTDDDIEVVLDENDIEILTPGRPPLS